MKELRDNWHGWLDIMGATFGSVAYRKDKFFSESVHTEPLRNVLNKTAIKIDRIEHNSWNEITATSPIGCFKGKYLVYRWYGNNVPTICFIHGSGEQPHNFGLLGSNSFRKIFSNDFDIEVNLILLMAPFHDGNQTDYIKALGSLNNYVGMLSTTTAMLNAIAVRLRLEGLQHKLYAVGVSLGGWVVNLHRTYYSNHFDSYIPMIAGTRLYDVFVTSQYSKLTASEALKNKDVLKDVLEFEGDFLENKKNNCFPLLARYDKLVELSTQRKGYEDLDLKILEKGHFTGMEATRELRKHIENVIFT